MSFEVKIKEGFRTHIFETSNGLLLYIIFLIVFYSIPYKFNQGIFISSICTITGLLTLTSYISETIIITNSSILAKKSFGFRKQFIDFSEIKTIHISKPIIRSSSYNYLITICGKKKIKISLISLGNLEKFIQTVKNINNDILFNYTKEVEEELKK